MSDRENTPLLQQISLVAQIFSSISVIVGIVVAVVTVYGTLRNATVAVTSVRLSTLAALKQFIDDDDKIRQQAESFLASEYNNPAKLHQLIQDCKSGKKAYDSDELKDLREVSHHYEVLATLVKHGYLDFDLVFETVPFPDDIWDATEQFRAELRTQNWIAPGHGLPDFLADSEDLRRRYRARRLSEKRLETQER